MEGVVACFERAKGVLACGAGADSARDLMAPSSMPVKGDVIWAEGAGDGKVGTWAEVFAWADAAGRG